MIKMNVPAMNHASVVVSPVLSFTDAILDKMETCLTIFRAQFKGDGNGTGRKSFPRIAQAMGRFDLKDLALFDHVRCPREPHRPSRAHLALGFLYKPALHLFFLSQSLEGTLRSGIDDALFFNSFGHVLTFFPLYPHMHSWRKTLQGFN